VRDAVTVASIDLIGGTLTTVASFDLIGGTLTTVASTDLTVTP